MLQVPPPLAAPTATVVWITVIGASVQHCSEKEPRDAHGKARAFCLSSVQCGKLKSPDIISAIGDLFRAAGEDKKMTILVMTYNLVDQLALEYNIQQPIAGDKTCSDADEEDHSNQKSGENQINRLVRINRRVGIDKLVAINKLVKIETVIMCYVGS